MYGTIDTFDPVLQTQHVDFFSISSLLSSCFLIQKAHIM